MDDDQGDFDLLAASLPPIPSPSRVKRRLIESAVAIDATIPNPSSISTPCSVRLAFPIAIQVTGCESGDASKARCR